MKTLTIFFLLISSLAAFIPTAHATTHKLVTIILFMDNESDEQVVQTIYTTLIAAEKVAKLLEVEITAQDKVMDDVFVFSIKTKKQKELTMKLFDEEGYELVAHRVLDVKKGSTYRALNVETLQDGTYTFELSDKLGRSTKKKVHVKRKEK
jgi:hypothetical protein